MQRNLEDFKDKQFDLVVVGGGVSGAAIAWDASLRGLSVALIDKGDFGAGTSTATSKLIHGGLRYLKNLEFGLVRESLRERRTLEKIAPNLVYPMPFVMPVYSWSMFFVMLAGMILYEILSFDKAKLKDPTKRLPHFKILGKKRILQGDPGVIPDGLVAGFQYYDCQSLNPDRLTLAFVQSAVDRGAVVANHVRAEGFLLDGKQVKGVRAQDRLGEDELEIHGRQTIIAAGPWADIVLAKGMGKQPHTRIRRSKGIHILTKEKPADFALTLQGRSGGHFFVIPWRGHKLIGTTDTEFVGKPDDCAVTAEDIAHFLDGINGSYGLEKIDPKDVVFGYAGLRPLVDRQTEDSYDVSRKHEIVDHIEDGFDNLYSVLGGKYTTSRELAEHAVDLVLRKIDRSAAPCSTKDTPLHGGDIPYMRPFLAEAHRDMRAFGEAAADMIAKQYGADYPKVAELAKDNPELGTVVGPGDAVLAEVVYAVRQEMALTLDDVLFRRTSIGTAGLPDDAELVKIADLVSEELGWDATRRSAEIEGARRKLRYPRLIGEPL